mgnify:FL=1|jgi:FAD synthetase
MKKRVVVFGIFDGIHEGHRSLFLQAKEYGDELAVIVGRDSASLRLKEKKPKHGEEERLRLVLQEEGVDVAILGDEEQSSYQMLKDLNPDVICLGYDQNALRQDLDASLVKEGRKIPLIMLNPHKEHEHHNSLYQ